MTGGSGARDRLTAAALVRRCAECRALRDGYAAAWARIGGEIAPVDPPPGLRRRVLARLPTRAAASSRRHGLAGLLAMFRARTSVAIALAIIVPLASLALSGALAPSPAFASTSTLTVIAGAVESSLDGVSWSAAADGVVIAAGTHVRTSAGARAVLTFFDGSLLTLDSGTSVAVRELSGGDGVVITLFQSIGRTWSSVHRAATGTRYQIGTPTATATVRGTGFETIVTSAGATTVATSDGLVAVSGAGSTVVVGESQRTDVQPGATPTIPVRVPSRTSLILRANVSMLAVDPAGLACGRTPGGDVVRQSPRCLVATDGAITLLDPAGGLYRVVVRSDSAADAELTARVTSAEGASDEQTARVSLAAGDQAVAPLALIVTDTVARTMDLRGFAVTAASPARLPLRATGAAAARAPETSRPTAPAAPTGVARATGQPDTRATREPAGASAAGRTPAADVTPPADATPPAGASVQPSPTAAVSPTPAPTLAALPTATPAPLPTADPTLLPLPTATVTIAPLPTATLPLPTVAPTALPSLVIQPTPSPTPTPTPSPTAPATPSKSPSPTPTQTAAPTPTAPTDVTAPVVVVDAPSELDTLLASTVTIIATVRDTESGVSSAPTATATTLQGSTLMLKSWTWDPASGRYTATFALPLVSGTVTYTVTAKDDAGNRGSGSATTLLR